MSLRLSRNTLRFEDVDDHMPPVSPEQDKRLSQANARILFHKP